MVVGVIVINANLHYSSEWSNVIRFTRGWRDLLGGGVSYFLKISIT